jgi:hypothetical protein
MLATSASLAPPPISTLVLSIIGEITKTTLQVKTRIALICPGT